MGWVNKLKSIFKKTDRNDLKKEIFFKHFEKLVTKESLINPKHTQDLIENIQTRITEIQDIQDEQIQCQEIMELEKQEQKVYEYIFGGNKELAMNLLEFTEGVEYGDSSKYKE